MVEKNYKQIHDKIKNIGIDTLEKSNLLENIVKELLISQLIENIQINEEEYKCDKKMSFYHSNKYLLKFLLIKLGFIESYSDTLIIRI